MRDSVTVAEALLAMARLGLAATEWSGRQLVRLAYPSRYVDLVRECESVTRAMTTCQSNLQYQPPAAPSPAPPAGLTGTGWGPA